MKLGIKKLFSIKPPSLKEGPLSRILITGVGKSGSTALFHSILNSMPPQTVSLFEPENERKTLPESTPPPAIVKSFLPYAEHFSFFEKKVLIVRDPRDNLISLLLYKPYNIIGKKFPGEKEKAIELVDSFVEMVRKKERFPGEVTVKALMAHLELHVGLSLENRMTLVTDYFAKHTDVFILKYEDFIDGNLGDLEKYLGLKLGKEIEVPQKFQRVGRSKSYGNWRQWFTNEDVDYFRPMMKCYLDTFNYPDDWETDDKPGLDPEIGSLYIERIIKEAAEHRSKKNIG
jgi:hypothetical protein